MAGPGSLYAIAAVRSDSLHFNPLSTLSMYMYSRWHTDAIARGVTDRDD